MKHLKTYTQLKESLNEAKIKKGSDIVKIMSNPAEWGSDMKDRVFTKGNNFIFADTFYYGQQKALDDLIKSWSPGGHYYEYFKDNYGIEVEVVASFSDFKAKGKFKKLTDDGVVYVELAIKNIGESLNEAGINDPVLMAFRAAKTRREQELAKPKRKPLYGKQREKAEDDLWQISQDLKDLYADRGQLLIDMEEEAEAEGGPIADEYGDKLNKIEDKIQKLIANRNKLEIRLAESVNEAANVKDEAIERLADFFRVSPNALKKFNFDGKDNIKELTKALNSTSDHGTEMYYKVAIDMAKKDLGINEREYSEDERKSMADKGLALPDGSFPIKDLEDLKNAIQAYGRSKNQSAAAKFIAKRAKELGADDLIPNTEDFQKSLKEIDSAAPFIDESLDEATTSWSKMMKGVKGGESGPWSLVAIENGKVVGQKIDIRVKDILPAHFEAMRKEFPKAKIHIEDGTGMIVWSEK